MHNKILSIMEYFMAVLISIMTLLVVIPIISREFFNASIVWADEFSRLLMIWMVYIGMAACYIRREHIKVDVVYNIMPDLLKRIVHLFGEVLMLSVSIFLIYNSYVLTISSWDQALPATGLSTGFLILPLLIGSIIMTVYILLNIFSDIKNKNNREMLIDSDNSSKVENY